MNQPLCELAASGGFSVISYNVLLPNSGDGWWVFKYYDASTPDAQRAWAHRQGLLKAQLLAQMADIVCIQEARGESFADDFRFMAEAGYGSVSYTHLTLPTSG